MSLPRETMVSALPSSVVISRPLGESSIVFSVSCGGEGPLGSRLHLAGSVCVPLFEAFENAGDVLLDLLDVFQQLAAAVVPAVLEFLRRLAKVVLAVRVADRILEHIGSVRRLFELFDDLLQVVADSLQLGVLDENSVAHGEHLSLMPDRTERGGPAVH